MTTRQQDSVVDAGAAPRHRQPPQRGRGRASKLLLGGLMVAVVSGGVGGAVAVAAQPQDDTPGIHAPAPVQAAASTAPTSIEQVAAKVLPSVVELQTNEGSNSLVGSGIVLTADGLILTNNHVVAAPAGSPGGQGNPQTRVTLTDGRTAPFSVVGTDPVHDIAVVRAQGLSGLTPITLGSSAALQTGQQVVAVGSPLGLNGTVTSGIISALNRRVSPAGDPANTALDAIQTDAPLNPGNSGGALVDMSGRLIGVNSAIATPGTASNAQTGSVGLGFAIPVDQAKPIADQLIASGRTSQAPSGEQVNAPSPAVAPKLP